MTTRVTFPFTVNIFLNILSLRYSNSRIAIVSLVLMEKSDFLWNIQGLQENFKIIMKKMSIPWTVIVKGDTSHQPDFQYEFF